MTVGRYLYQNFMICREFHKILQENGFPEEMTVDHVRKKWSYTWDVSNVMINKYQLNFSCILSNIKFTFHYSLCPVFTNNIKLNQVK